MGGKVLLLGRVVFDPWTRFRSRMVSSPEPSTSTSPASMRMSSLRLAPVWAAVQTIG